MSYDYFKRMPVPSEQLGKNIAEADKQIIELRAKMAEIDEKEKADLHPGRKSFYRSLKYDLHRKIEALEAQKSTFELQLGKVK